MDGGLVGLRGMDGGLVQLQGIDGFWLQSTYCDGGLVQGIDSGFECLVQGIDDVFEPGIGGGLRLSIDCGFVQVH